MASAHHVGTRTTSTIDVESRSRQPEVASTTADAAELIPRRSDALDTSDRSQPEKGQGIRQEVGDFCIGTTDWSVKIDTVRFGTKSKVIEMPENFQIEILSGTGSSSSSSNSVGEVVLDQSAKCAIVGGAELTKEATFDRVTDVTQGITGDNQSKPSNNVTIEQYDDRNLNKNNDDVTNTFIDDVSTELDCDITKGHSDEIVRKADDSDVIFSRRPDTAACRPSQFDSEFPNKTHAGRKQKVFRSMANEMPGDEERINRSCQSQDGLYRSCQLCGSGSNSSEKSIGAPQDDNLAEEFVRLCSNNWCDEQHHGAQAGEEKPPPLVNVVKPIPRVEEEKPTIFYTDNNYDTLIVQTNEDCSAASSTDVDTSNVLTREKMWTFPDILESTLRRKVLVKQNIDKWLSDLPKESQYPNSNNCSKDSDEYPVGVATPSDGVENFPEVGTRSGRTESACNPGAGETRQFRQVATPSKLPVGNEGKTSRTENPRPQENPSQPEGDKMFERISPCCTIV